MASTPFLDVLTPAQKAHVRLRALGDKRPSYYDPLLAIGQAQETKTGVSGEQSAEVQISEDMEAFLILLPTVTKQAILKYFSQVISSGVTTEDITMMQQVIAARADSFVQANIDSAIPVINFETAQKDVQTQANKFLLQAAINPVVTTQPIVLKQPDPVAGVTQTFSNIFNTLNAAHTTIGQANILATHDRIVDAGVMASYSNETGERTREVLSWVTVFTAYL